MKRRSRCFTNYAPVLCVRSVIRLAISTQLRWINCSWAGVQKVKGVAFTIRQSSLERLRYVPERLPLRGQDGHFMLVDYGYDLEALGYVHKPLVIDGDPERIEAHLPMIHIAFSNLKSWLLGTHHGVSHRHLQAYLNEFVFRFNRRFYPMTAFNSALGLAAHASAPTYKKLYSGDWTHPAT